MKKLFVGAAGLGLIASVAVGPSLIASAAAPSQAGWWSSTNPGSIMGTPTPPAPPDVPDKGLLIEGGSGSTSGAGDTGPTAYAAVSYEVGDGASVGKLTLTVAPNSASTPNTTLEICPLTNSAFNAEQGGPASDGPAYNCSKNATAAQSSSGSTYDFQVSNLVSGGFLSVAILPTSPTDRVVLAPPDDKSLAATAAPTSTDSSGAGAVPSSDSPSASPDSSSASPVGTGSTDSSSSAAASAPSGGGLSSVSATPDSSGADSTGPALSPATSASSAATPAAAPASSSAAPAASASAPAASAGTATYNPAASTTISPAKPLAVGILIAVLLIGGLLWTGASRAAIRKLDGSPASAEA